VEPKSAATEAAVFVADGLMPIGNGNDKHNVTERSSPAVQSISGKMEAAENRDIGVEVNTDPGSWAEIFIAVNQNVFD
jgi:hypothetical protein